MQGMGLFACRKDAWPGFNPLFRGFGAEEGYIHEKVRQGGGRTLCLPFLRWMHRFNRPLGAPYPNIWEDRIRNYYIGWRELGLPTEAWTPTSASTSAPMLAAASSRRTARTERMRREPGAARLPQSETRRRRIRWPPAVIRVGVGR